MKHTLKRNKEYGFLYRRGKSSVSSALVMYYYKNRRGSNRYGITAGKKVGNAVKRNRARRVIREAYYRLCGQIKPGYDFVFVARGKTPYVKCAEVQRQMYNQLKKENLLAPLA